MEWQGKSLGATPKARTEGLVVQGFDDELLVFDDLTTTAHNLNRTAALVWRACDGATTIGDIVVRLADETGEPENPEVVLFALRQLEERGLLDDDVTLPTDRVTSRRQLLKLLGATTVSIPVVTSLLVPSAAAAASGNGATGGSSGGSSGGTSGGSSGGSS